MPLSEELMIRKRLSFATQAARFARVWGAAALLALATSSGSAAALSAPGGKLIAHSGSLVYHADSYAAVSAIDIDAQLFFDNAGLVTSTTYHIGSPYEISGVTILAALDRRVRDLKGEYNPNYTTSDVWTSALAALYPFVGGTAAAHKLNLRNPANTDAAYRLIYPTNAPSNGPRGIVGNGTNQYARIPAELNAALTAGSATFGIHILDNIQSTAADFGARSGVSTAIYLQSCGTAAGTTKLGAALNNDTSVPLGTSTDSRGLWLLTRAITASFTVKRDDTLIATLTRNTASSVTPQPIYLCAINVDGTATSFSSRPICTWSAWKRALTAAEELAEYNSDKAFNTTLLRQTT